MITTVETRAGVHWVTCRDAADRAQHEEASRVRAVAELTRLGRPPQQGDTRTQRELWDDAKSREPEPARMRVR